MIAALPTYAGPSASDCFVSLGRARVLGQQETVTSEDCQAKSMPSYLAPLSQDVALDKLGFYEAIWNEAEPI
jgi:hypothetical protein